MIVKEKQIVFVGLALVALVLVFGALAFELAFLPGQGEEINPGLEASQGELASVDEAAVVIKQAGIFYDEERFFMATERAENVQAKSDIRAIIVPHHLVASEYIAGLIKSAGGRPIKNVVVFGPNHNNIGTAPVAVARADWETPFGALKYNPELVGKFMADNNIRSNPEIFDNEHSIGGILPFVKYYLKEARVMPVAVSSYAEYADMEKISEWLASNLDEESLIIFSLDFSHYLSREEADKNDDLTKELILANDIGKIMELNNDYVDSPGILALSLMYAKEKGLETNFAYHGNSFDFVTLKPSETTSYFGISFAGASNQPIKKIHD